MTHEEVKNMIIEIINSPIEELKKTHPTVADHGTRFIEYTENGDLTLQFTIKPEYRNGGHILQGGVLASFIDDTFGLFSFVSTGGTAPLSTTNLSINYHKAVPEGVDKIIVTSHIITAGKNILSMSAEAKNENGQLVATAQTNMINLNHVRIYI